MEEETNKAKPNWFEGESGDHSASKRVNAEMGRREKRRMKKEEANRYKEEAEMWPACSFCRQADCNIRYVTVRQGI